MSQEVHLFWVCLSIWFDQFCVNFVLKYLMINNQGNDLRYFDHLIFAFLKVAMIYVGIGKLIYETIQLHCKMYFPNKRAAIWFYKKVVHLNFGFCSLENEHNFLSNQKAGKLMNVTWNKLYWNISLDQSIWSESFFFLTLHIELKLFWKNCWKTTKTLPTVVKFISLGVTSA